MAVTDTWADWSTTAASNGPAGAATPEIDDELRNVKAQVKANAWSVANIASEAIQETGTSNTTIVTPGVQKYHPSACKAWLNCDIAGAIGQSFNIASITDTGTGIVSGNFTVNFTDGSFGCAANAMCAGAIRVTLLFSQEVNSFQIRSYTASFVLADPDRYHLIAFGAQ